MYGDCCAAEDILEIRVGQHVFALNFKRGRRRGRYASAAFSGLVVSTDGFENALDGFPAAPV